MANLVTAEQIGNKGISYQFAGREMQALVVQMDNGEKLVAAKDAIAWLTEDVRIDKHDIGQLLVCESSIGPSIVGLVPKSADSKIIELESDQNVVVRISNFVCSDVDISISLVGERIGKKWLGVGGVELIELSAGKRYIWGGGDVITYQLTETESLLVDKTRLIAWTQGVKHEDYSAVEQGGIQVIQGSRLFKISGPGRVWLQLT